MGTSKNLLRSKILIPSSETRKMRKKTGGVARGYVDGFFAKSDEVAAEGAKLQPKEVFRGAHMVDKKIVLKHLGELEKCVKQLSKHKDCTVKQLLSDFDLRWAVERGLQLAIQNVLDISSHILVDTGANGLDDYTSMIDQMGARGIIPKEFAKKIRGMAGLRNVLVHDYVDIDTRKLHGYVAAGLDDFKKFAKYIADYLEHK